MEKLLNLAAGILLAACADKEEACPPVTEDIGIIQNVILLVRDPAGEPVCDAKVTTSSGFVSFAPGTPCRFAIELHDPSATVTVRRDPYREKVVSIARPCPGQVSQVEVQLESP